MEKAKKHASTFVKVFLRYALLKVPDTVIYIKGTRGGILIGEYQYIKPLINNLKTSDYYIEVLYQNALYEYPLFLDQNVRIEKNAVIRAGVTLEDQVIILMNAVVNVNSCIGSRTMIDMNAVVGSGAKIGSGVHVGAGAIISGVLEPVNQQPVIIEDDVFIGAGAVILPGLKIGKGAVVGAGSVVTKDVESYTVVYGVPAQFIKRLDIDTKSKVLLNDDLRAK